MKSKIKYLVSITLILMAFRFSIAYGQYVNGYCKKNGTYVEGHHRSEPDGNSYNNYSTKGNINPYTRERGTIDPYSSSFGGPNSFNNSNTSYREGNGANDSCLGSGNSFGGCIGSGDQGFRNDKNSSQYSLRSAGNLRRLFMWRSCEKISKINQAKGYEN